MSYYSQEQVFIFFFIIGIIISMFFDFFRVLRKSFNTSNLVTFFEDLIFVLISGFLFIFSIIKLNGGEIRFFLFLGVFSGILIYSLTLSRLYVIIFYEIIKMCKFIAKIPIFIIKSILICLKKVLNRF